MGIDCSIEECDGILRSLPEDHRAAFDCAVACVCAQVAETKLANPKKMTVGLQPAAIAAKPVSLSVLTSNCFMISLPVERVGAMEPAIFGAYASDALARGFYRTARKSTFPNSEEILACRLVTEGLSRAYASDLGYQQGEGISIDPESYAAYIERMEAYVTSKSSRDLRLYSEHFDVFDRKGGGELSLIAPQWAGVMLGDMLALGYLAHTKKQALEVVSVNCWDVIEAWFDQRIKVDGPVRSGMSPWLGRWLQSHAQGM